MIAINKWERLERLIAMGFNTPNYRRINSIDETFSLFNNAESDSKWSIRSQPTLKINSKTSGKDAIKQIATFVFVESNPPPHVPVSNRCEAAFACIAMIEHGFIPLVCSVINPENAEFAGAVVRSDDKLILELALGKVMVRRVVRDGVIDERFVLTAGKPFLIQSAHPTNFTLDKKKLLNIHEKLTDPVIPKDFQIELSWYKTLEGRLHDHLIFWDGYFLNENAAEGWIR